MKRIVIITLIVIMLIAGIGYFFSRRSRITASSSVETVKVVKKDFSQTVSSSGKIAADRAAILKFQTSGKLVWVGVKEGDTVSAYQAIASLDRREVQKTLEKTLRDYSATRNDFEELWRVTYNGRSNPNDAINDTMKRILEKNQWDLESAVLDVELKSLAVEYATLITPIAGIVTHIDTPIAGIHITPATSTFEIVDPKSLIFEANIDEIDVGSLSVGQSAQIFLDAFKDQEFIATVSAIAYTAHTSAGGATVFSVKLSLPHTGEMRIGLNGDATINTNTIPNALTVPDTAVRIDGDTRYVYRKTGKKYEKVIVTTDQYSGKEIVINSGLQEGDEIVISGFSNINP